MRRSSRALRCPRRRAAVAAHTESFAEELLAALRAARSARRRRKKERLKAARVMEVDEAAAPGDAGQRGGQESPAPVARERDQSEAPQRGDDPEAGDDDSGPSITSTIWTPKEEEGDQASHCSGSRRSPSTVWTKPDVAQSSLPTVQIETADNQDRLPQRHVTRNEEVVQPVGHRTERERSRHAQKRGGGRGSCSKRGPPGA